ncbi:hypothetical protein D8Y22_00330 [Salinadaptatus halalkaliphilus]|uniref:Uncharacterized protein n=1 Tax=Salinadaptatus halalkaliphilus TaxID=2419781 RepID=A0A4S3TQP0_9EURY|nr:hypothetical protein [Salinadaptatus halalkaliphilus]THE66616.1 hypothetical protein D8Y22_00330 [Salinadaptatus halalkaliphilus]
MDIDIVEELKQPEYTGENRCEPCTIVNVAIAVVAGSLVARRSRIGGVLAVGVSLALIYLRGYLVPGTPTLTKRYLPPAVLRWFGKDPDLETATGFDGQELVAESAAESTTEEPTVPQSETPPDEHAVDAPETEETPATDPEPESAPITDLETYFLDRDVLEPCADRDDLCVTADFERAWFAEIDALEASDLDAPTAIEAFGFDVEAEEFSLEYREDAVLLVSKRGMAGRWPSRAAILADVAASRALETWVNDWETVDADTRGRICNALRMFLERCPTGGDVEMGEEVVESCCSSHDVIAVTCEESGERLFEQRLDAVDQ